MSLEYCNGGHIALQKNNFSSQLEFSLGNLGHDTGVVGLAKLTNASVANFAVNGSPMFEMSTVETIVSHNFLTVVSYWTQNSGGSSSMGVV